MNYIKPEDIKEYVSKNPEGIAGMSEELAVMVNHFAELIVRECIDRGNDLAKHYINNHSEQDQAFLLAAIADYSNEIEKHFGIE